MRFLIVILVLNNQILGYQKHGKLSVFGAYTDADEFTPVDHVAIARAVGCNGVRIEQPDQFQPALNSTLKSQEVTVIDIVADEHAYLPRTSFGGKEAFAH